MFKLKSVQIGPFRSFVEPQKIEFPENGMVLIEGRNLITGGSSRSGKTNLLLAIKYALGDCPLPSTVLGSWNSDEPPTVNLKTQINDLEVDFNRAKKLEIVKNGKKFEGSAVQREEELLNLIGLSPEVLSALTYRGQREDGIFLSKKNAEKSEFLVPLLDLERFENAQKVGQKQINYLGVDHGKLNSAVEAIKGTIDNFKIEGNINELNSDLFKLKNELSEVNQKIVDCQSNQESARAKNESDAVAAKEYALKNNAFYQEQDKLKKLQTELPVFIADEIELNKHKDLLSEAIKNCEILLKENDVKRKAYENQKNALTFRKYSLEQDQKKRNNIQHDINRYVDEIDTIKANKCPTCQQEWIKGQDRIDALQNSIKGFYSLLNQLSQDEQEISEITIKLEQLGEFEPDPKIEKYNKIREIIGKNIATELAKIDSAKAIHNSKFAKEIAEVKSAISNIQVIAVNSYNNVKSKWSELSQVYTREQAYLNEQKAKIQQFIGVVQGQINQYETSKKQLDKIQSDFDTKKAELNKIEGELNTEKDLLALVGRDGFLGKIFDEVLDEITTETNEMLAQVANTADVTIEFKSETLTQSGDVKKNIIPIVTVGGNSAPIKSALSGGMLTMVELSVDLAVGRVISRRTGIVPGFLILDEAFNGLDNVCKEGCFELLKLYAQDKLVLVIDHSTEFKSLFSKIINVEFDGTCSKIVDLV